MEKIQTGGRMNTNNRIKKIRKKLKLSQKEFANKLALSDYTRISDIEREKVKPSIDVLEKIIDSFEINANWLLSGHGDMFVTKQESKMYELRKYLDGRLKKIVDPEPETEKTSVRIPIVGEIAAGLPVAVSDNDYIDTLTVDRYLVKNKDDYVCLRVNGNSMEPEIKHNDILLIKKDCTWKQAMQQVVALRIEGEITLKRLSLDNRSKMIVLNAANQDYQPIVIDPERVNDIKLVGKLAYLFREY